MRAGRPWPRLVTHLRTRRRFSPVKMPDGSFQVCPSHTSVNHNIGICHGATESEKSRKQRALRVPVISRRELG